MGKPSRAGGPYIFAVAEKPPKRDEKEFVFDRFPPFFDGLLPEGLLLEGLLKLRKINKFDYLSTCIRKYANV